MQETFLKEENLTLWPSPVVINRNLNLTTLSTTILTICRMAALLLLVWMKNSREMPRRTKDGLKSWPVLMSVETDSVCSWRTFTAKRVRLRTNSSR